MSIQEASSRWVAAFKQSLENNSFIKISLGNYKGDDTELVKILVRKVIIKGKEQLGFTYRNRRNDITKNFELKDGSETIEDLITHDFGIATLMTSSADYQFECLKSGKKVFRELKASQSSAQVVSHDRIKHRHIESIHAPYLTDLKITSSEGNVLKDAQDKYKQINHYIDLLRAMLEDLRHHENLHVVDMGSGKGYLTFALYDYLTNQLGVNATVIGVEFRQDLVDLCNKIAAKNQFNHLQFEQGRIEDFPCDKTNVLIALHACDTATDDAIYKGIEAGAELIVVAPCCHKQIRREMEKATIDNPLNLMLRHGIFMERQAEMLTDSLRALFLEASGYKVKVLEFISASHTPKNVMIVAEKKQVKSNDYEAKMQRINELKTMFGIKTIYLETLLN